MAGVNDWRFRLAEEEDRRRRKFGLGDLLSFLQTAAGVYTGVKGVQEAGKRTALMEGQQAFAEKQAGIDETARIGGEMRGLGQRGYEQVETPPLTGSPGSMAGYAVATQGTTSFPDMPGRFFRQTPLPDELSGVYHRDPSGGMLEIPGARERVVREGRAKTPPEYDPSQPFTLTDEGWTPTPGFLSDEEKELQRQLAATRSGGGGYDPGDALKIEAMTEAEMSRRYPDAPRDMEGGLVYTPDMEIERAAVFNEYKAQFGYAAPPPDEPEPSYGAVYMEMAADFNSPDPAIRARAEAEWPEFLQGDPEGAAIVTLLRQNPGALQAAPGQSDWGALGFEAEPTPGMVEAQLAETGQGLYRQQTDEGLGWSDPEKKATHDALTELLRRLRAEAYRTQQSASPMRPPVIPPFDRRF